MIVSDVLKITLKNISREDILETKIFDESSTQEATSEQQKVVDDLVCALNDTIQSIVYVYFPLKKLENITVTNGQFDYSSLTKPLIDVFKLKNKDGVSQKFTTFPTFFTCPSGSYTITYSYAPTMVNALTDAITVPEGKVNERMLAVGTTSRFYLKRGMYQDSNVWDVSFQRLLLVGQRPKHMPKMDARGWY